MKEKLYWLNLVNPGMVSDRTLETNLKEVASTAFRLNDFIIFTSSEKIEVIHETLKKDKPSGLMYLLVDMTESLTSETFKGVMNPSHYKNAKQLMELINSYKKTSEVKTEETEFTTLSTKEQENYLNEILDKISAKGIESLNETDKRFLEFSKKKKNN